MKQTSNKSDSSQSTAWKDPKDDFKFKLIASIRPFVIDGKLDEVTAKVTLMLKDYRVDAMETLPVLYKGEENSIILQRFLATKIACGRSAKTINYYRSTITIVLRHIGKGYREITADDIRIYLARRLMVDHATKITCDNERRVLSSFFGWLETEEYIQRNPMRKVEHVKPEKTKKEAFSEMDIEKIRNACKDARQTALIEFLLSTWCRISEVAGVKISDIRGDRCIVKGKGDKERTVFLNARCLFAINKYLSERTDKNPYLFAASTVAKKQFTKGLGTRIIPTWWQEKEYVDPQNGQSAMSLQSLVRTIGIRAEVDNCHPHRFRRTGATLALNRGMPIINVKNILGHDNVATTQRYLDIRDDDLHEAHKKYAF